MACGETKNNSRFYDEVPPVKGANLPGVKRRADLREKKSCRNNLYCVVCVNFGASPQSASSRVNFNPPYEDTSEWLVQKKN